MNLLIVEDNDLDYKLICKSITSEHDILRAETLKEAVSLLKDKSYHCDIVILDLNLPDSKDIQTFNSVKNLAPKIPIIITTSVNSKSLNESVAQDGCFFLFQKNELPNKIFDRAILFANIYYGSEHERAARGTSTALRNLKNFFNTSASFKSKENK